MLSNTKLLKNINKSSRKNQFCLSEYDLATWVCDDQQKTWNLLFLCHLLSQTFGDRETTDATEHKVMELVKNKFYYLQFQWTIKVIQLKSKSKYAALLRLVHSSQHRTESLRCWSGGNLISTHWKWLKCCRYGI